MTLVDADLTQVNAAQAIPEGAAEHNEVSVATGVGADGRVFVEVADTGRGMSRDVARRIFDPFFTTKAVGEGTGLGLSICHTIVAAHGGEIVVESALGKGSTFKVFLPVTTARPSATPPVVREAARSRRGRVLVVDDDAGVALSLKRILGHEHHVETCTGGRAALDCLASGATFDVILCDLMMPDVSGMDVHTALVKERPELATRLIFMTGGAFTARSREFLANTEQPWMEKPFEAAAIRRAVAAMM